MNARHSKNLTYTSLSSVHQFMFFLLLILGLFQIKILEAACPDLKFRVDCHPDKEATEEKCIARGCDWCPVEDTAEILDSPPCVTRSDHGYLVQGQPEETVNSISYNLRRSSNASYFGGDFENLKATFHYDSDYRLRITIKPVGLAEPRYEVPVKINQPYSKADKNLYTIEVPKENSLFSFKIKRSAGKDTAALLDTSLGGLTFSPQFIQFSSFLPTTNLYGIGENEQSSFKHKDFNYTTYALYARSQSPEGRANLYGVHPYYTVMEEDGNCHSVMVLNSNAQEFTLNPSPGYTYRTIGGILDIYIFMGPTPEKTVQQFTEAIGRQKIPPYWSLGFQISRWGYDNIDNLKASVERNAAAGIPQDVQYVDIDVMLRFLDFTTNNETFRGLSLYVDDLKEKGIKFVPIVVVNICTSSALEFLTAQDPGINCENENVEGVLYMPCYLGKDKDIWLKRPDGNPVTGLVWPGKTYFPDFFHAEAQEFWYLNLFSFEQLENINFDGIWIDMNEPASWTQGDFYESCADNEINNPPYVPGIVGGKLYDKTICPDVKHSDRSKVYLHYDVHSMYGYMESKVTYNALKERQRLKRPFVLSRSTFLGSGQYASHWLGDNYSRWSNLHNSIIGILQFNHFGIPHVGADICGFFEDAEEEMCQRWHQLGSFYPFARNHNRNETKDQDPASWSPKAVNSTKKALEMRYTLLPYFYTLFYLHEKDGNTVARALWHEFPQDPETLDIDRQFLLGSGLLVSPVLEAGKLKVEAYFPDARWYSFTAGAELKDGRNKSVELSAPLDVINVHVRGGHIIPTQGAAINTKVARSKPYGLIVAIDDDETASGLLYIDDGDYLDPLSSKYDHFLLSMEFKFNSATEEGHLEGTIVNEGISDITKGRIFDSIKIWGYNSDAKVKTVKINNYKVDATIVRDDDTGEIEISGITLLVRDIGRDKFTVTFSKSAFITAPKILLIIVCALGFGFDTRYLVY